MAVVTMLYGEKNALNALYERALKSHCQLALIQHRPIHILRQDVAAGFWNKPTYILSLLVAELEKEIEERMTWLMWVDGDSIILNTALNPEIFLPPSDFDHVNFLVTKDLEGMNTGIFFLRVCEWSVRFMVKTIAYPLFQPEVDLGRNADQEVMARLASEKDFRSHTLYQPRAWYNAYQLKQQFGYEGSPGSLLVHFPGLEEERLSAMEKWLYVVEGPQATEWTIPLNQTEYPAQISDFWNEVRKAKETMYSAEGFTFGLKNVSPVLTSAISRLGDILQNGTGDTKAVVEATALLSKALADAQS